MSDLFGKAKDFLNTDKGEETSGKALDAAATFANERTGGNHEEQVRRIRDAADSHLGRE